MRYCRELHTLKAGILFSVGRRSCRRRVPGAAAAVGAKATEPAPRETRLPSRGPRLEAGRSPALSVRVLLRLVRSLNHLESASRSFCGSGVGTGWFLPPALPPCRMACDSFSPVGLCFPVCEMGPAMPRTWVLSDPRRGTSRERRPRLCRCPRLLGVPSPSASPCPSPTQALTRPDAARLARSDGVGCVQGGVAGGSLLLLLVIRHLLNNLGEVEG